MSTEAWTLRPDLFATDVNEATIALDLDASAYYGVEATGRRIWQLLETPQTESSIVEVLCDEYDVTAAQCAASVEAFLAELRKLGLIIPAAAGD